MRQQTFLDYDGFVKKFTPRKTTDDCYTPPAVYDAVLAWARNRYGISDDAQIVRPFFPGGDYESFDYPPGCVVVDNPPFSILTKIVRFYQARKIPFFLFANSLTLCAPLSVGGVGAVVIDTTIRYHNGANVNTGFVTNLGDNIIEVSPELDTAVAAARGKSDQRRAAVKRKVTKPDAVVTGATLGRLAHAGVRFCVKHGEAVYVHEIGEAGYALFGGGLLLSERAAAERAAAERAAAERAAAERAAAKRAAKIEIKLSAREREIQRMMAAKAEKDGRQKQGGKDGR